MYESRTYWLLRKKAKNGEKKMNEEWEKALQAENAGLALSQEHGILPLKIRRLDQEWTDTTDNNSNWDNCTATSVDESSISASERRSSNVLVADGSETHIEKAQENPSVLVQDEVGLQTLAVPCSRTNWDKFSASSEEYPPSTASEKRNPSVLVVDGCELSSSADLSSSLASERRDSTALVADGSELPMERVQAFLYSSNGGEYPPSLSSERCSQSSVTQNSSVIASDEKELHMDKI